MKSAGRGVTAWSAVALAAALPLTAAAAGVPFSPAVAPSASLSIAADGVPPGFDVDLFSFSEAAAERILACAGVGACAEYGLPPALDFLAEDTQAVGGGGQPLNGAGADGRNARLVMAADFLDPYMTRVAAEEAQRAAAEIEVRALGPVVVAAESSGAAAPTRYGPIDFVRMLVSDYKVELLLAGLALCAWVVVDAVKGRR
jgi:hypothetical protein